MSEERSTQVVSADLPRDLVAWMDLYLAEQRVIMLKAGKEDAAIPTRSSFIRNLLLKAKNNGHKL